MNTGFSRLLTPCLVSLLLLAGCDKSPELPAPESSAMVTPEDSAHQTGPTQQGLPSDQGNVSKQPSEKDTQSQITPDNAIARIGDEYVTEEDLQRTVMMTMPARLRARVLREARESMLQALVRRKAMAQIAAEDLTAEELKEIGKVVTAYREQLLSNALIHKNGNVTAVSAADIKTYYEANSVRWAGSVSASFELLWVSQDAKGENRIQAGKRLQNLRSVNDWKQAVKTAGELVKDLRYWSGKAELASIEIGLQPLVSSLAPGETSRPTGIGGRLYLARMLKRNEQPAQTLGEVSASIRKTLKTDRLKQAMQQLEKTHEQRVPVTYFKKPEADGNKPSAATGSQQ